MHFADRNLLFFIATLYIHAVFGEDVEVNNLNRCLDSRHHKETPGMEFENFRFCTPWAKRSCCTNKTSQSIERDGVLTLYNMKWDHCSRSLSKACREWFLRDTCFYECSPNVGPYIVVDKRSRVTRRERIVDVPLCASDCDDWFNACKDDLTCTDNFLKWNWTKQGNKCLKECRTFKEYFNNSVTFCKNVFGGTFKYAKGVPGQDCFKMWPNVDKDGRNPNELVARISQQSRKWSAAISKKVVDYLDRCIATNNHKKKPGPEYDSKECVPWRSHGCCSANTTSAIKKDGALTLFNRKWNHCGKLSDKCREFFIKNTCFYSCSPNLAPWIVNDPMGGSTRTEKFKSIPLCSDDCDAWFDACKNDMTCSNDWSDTWKWTDNDKCDKQKCMPFKDYFTNSTMLCNKIFDHTFIYTSGKPGNDCMALWPDSGGRDLNLEFASTVTRNIVASSSTLLYPAFMLISSILWAVVLTL